MRRRYRLSLAAAALAGSIAAVILLTWLSSAGEGPISATLTWFGTHIGSAEYRVRQKLTGAIGRSEELSWFRPYRDDINRLRHPDAVLLGAYDSGIPVTLNGVVELERSTSLRLPLVQFYSAWGDRPEERFPVGLATAVWDIGSVPVITWEPWLVDFESARHPSLPLRDARDRHGMAAVARGDYDFYVDAWAAAAAKFGHPLFLRFGHEMNDPYRYPWGPQNNTKEEYIAAWRHVHARFDAAGARNVIWVWSPHVAYQYWDLYYPGDEYVDWVATGVLNFGAVSLQWSRWWSFDQIFGTRYPRLALFGKPIMIAEFSSLAVGGDRAAWYREALGRLPARYPAVRALLFFNSKSDQTVTYQKLDWSIDRDEEVRDAVTAAAKPWGNQPLRQTESRSGQ